MDYNGHQLQLSLNWTAERPGKMIAKNTDFDPIHPVLELQRQPDGWTWRIDRVPTTYKQTSDFQALEAWQAREGIAFEANPQTSLYPWKATNTSKALHLSSVVKKQRSTRIKRNLRYDLEPILEKLRQRQESSTWKKAALTQTPMQIWDQRGLFTDYQNWTIYRITIGSLNLFHSGWPEIRDCPEPTCSTATETIDHIIWECEKAQLAWKTWLDHCYGYASEPSERAQLIPLLATRQAPPTPTSFLATAKHCITRWTSQLDKAMATIWKFWSTVTPVMLWRLRNRHGFKGLHTKVNEIANIVWAAGIFQAKAIASEWKSRSATRVQGYCLEVCQRIVASTNPMHQPEPLDVWMVCYHKSVGSQAAKGGGWLVHQLKEERSWILHAAGSIKFSSQSAKEDYTAITMSVGLTRIAQVTRPANALLVVETLEIAPTKTDRKVPPTTTLSNTIDEEPTTSKPNTVA